MEIARVQSDVIKKRLEIAKNIVKGEDLCALFSSN